MIELLTAVATTPSAPIRPEHEPKWEELHPNTSHVIRRLGHATGGSSILSPAGKIVFVGSEFVQVISGASVGIQWPAGVTEAHVILNSITTPQQSRDVIITGSGNGTDWITDIYWNSAIKHNNRSFNTLQKLTRVNSVGEIGQSKARVMFFRCTMFNQDLSNLIVDELTDMRYMFAESPKYNQPMATWNTGNVVNMSYMFSKCTDFNQDLSMLDVGKVTDRTNYDQLASSWIAAYKPKFK